jgi:DNA replication and repair protein RecF
MRITTLSCYQFRNLVDDTVSFVSGVNFLIGNNGQGKTNIVEAIHLLATARSFRTSSMEDLPRWGCEDCSVFAQVVTEPKHHEGITYRAGVAIRKGSRQAFIDDQPLSSLSAFLGKVLVVTFSPSDIAIVKGPPSLRRKFFDKHLIDCMPQLAPVLFEAHHAIRLKAKVLKDAAPDRHALDTCDEIIARTTEALTKARQEFISRVELRARLLLAQIPTGDGTLSVHYEPSLGRDCTEGAAREMLKEARPRESRQRSCLKGPHRDDYAFELGGHEARSFASQGQARSLILALKLALVDLIEESRGDHPILILDDFESELDRTRTEVLLQEVRITGRQVFVTGVVAPRLGIAGDRPVRCFEVAQGAVNIKES